MKSKKKLVFFFKLLISFLFVAYLIYFVDWSEVFIYLKKIKLVYVFSYLFFYILGIIISARKWQVLANFKDFSHRLKFYVEVYLIGAFINNFLPSFVGGDSYRIFRLGEKEKRFKASSGTVIVDRISGLLASMVMSVFFSILNFRVYLQNRFLISLLLGLIGFLAGFILMIFLIKWKREFFKTKLGFLPKKVVEYFLDFASFEKMMVSFMSYAFLFNFLGVAVANFTLFQALGVELSFLNYLSVIFLISILSAFPISVSNIGVKEWGYATLFGFFGVPASAAVSVAIISRFLQMLVNFGAFPLYLKQKRKIERLEG